MVSLHKTIFDRYEVVTVLIVLLFDSTETPLRINWELCHYVFKCCIIYKHLSEQDIIIAGHFCLLQPRYKRNLEILSSFQTLFA